MSASAASAASRRTHSTASGPSAASRVSGDGPGYKRGADRRPAVSRTSSSQVMTSASGRQRRGLPEALERRGASGTSASATHGARVSASASRASMATGCARVPASPSTGTAGEAVHARDGGQPRLDLGLEARVTLGGARLATHQRPERPDHP